MSLRIVPAARFVLAATAFFALGLPAPRAGLAADAQASVQAELQGKINSLSDVLPRLEDQTALKQFYAGRDYMPLWFDETGPTLAASQVIQAFAGAPAWGLNAADFELHSPAKDWTVAAKSRAEIAVAEYEVSALILKYANQARGGRIPDPSRLLSDFLDRKPVLPVAAEVLPLVSSGPNPGDVLRAFHPQHPQFLALHDLYVRLRDEKPQSQSVSIAAQGPLLVPGQANSEIPRLRHRLGLPAASRNEDTYDNALKTAVEAFQESTALEVDGVIGPATRKALNANDAHSKDDKLNSIVASMEQWRWMPQELGGAHLLVNIPAFTVDLIRDGKSSLHERVIVGKAESPTPVFSKNMTSIVLRPSWFLPDTIKQEKLLSAARHGRSLEDEGIVVKKGSRVVKSWTVDWAKAKLSEYSIFQPSGDGNALGDVKFLFPNAHSVYLHDTPNKSLFAATDRTFSHGCIRLKNPLSFAQRLLDADRGAGTWKVAQLVEDGPGSNQIMLEKPLPVHIGYFSVWIDSTGQPEYFGDPYGHDKRVVLALNQKWAEIDRGVEIAGRRDEKLPSTADIAPIDRPAKKRAPVAQNDTHPARQRHLEKSARAEEPRHQARVSSTRGSVGQMMNAAYLQ